MKRAWYAFEFILKNFATPIAFFLVFQWKGSKPAIAVAMVFALSQLLLQRVLKQVISPFFITAAGFTVLFGSMDLFGHETRYFRLAPAAENFAMGIIFAASVVADKPIALWFAQALPAALRPEVTGDIMVYLRKLTLIWVVYFILKSLIFLDLAFRVDLGRLIILRSIIGGSSLAIMIGGEILYRKRYSVTFCNARRCRK